MRPLRYGVPLASFVFGVDAQIASMSGLALHPPTSSRPRVKEKIGNPAMWGEYAGKDRLRLCFGADNSATPCLAIAEVIEERSAHNSTNHTTKHVSFCRIRSR